MSLPRLQNPNPIIPSFKPNLPYLTKHNNKASFHAKYLKTIQNINQEIDKTKTEDKEAKIQLKELDAREREVLANYAKDQKAVRHFAKKRHLKETRQKLKERLEQLESHKSRLERNDKNLENWGNMFHDLHIDIDGRKPRGPLPLPPVDPYHPRIIDKKRLRHIKRGLFLEGAGGIRSREYGYSGGSGQSSLVSNSMGKIPRVYSPHYGVNYSIHERKYDTDWLARVHMEHSESMAWKRNAVSEKLKNKARLKNQRLLELSRGLHNGMTSSQAGSNYDYDRSAEEDFSIAGRSDDWQAKNAYPQIRESSADAKRLSNIPESQERDTTRLDSLKPARPDIERKDTLPPAKRSEALKRTNSRYLRGQIDESEDSAQDEIVPKPPIHFKTPQEIQQGMRAPAKVRNSIIPRKTLQQQQQSQQSLSQLNPSQSHQQDQQDDSQLYPQSSIRESNRESNRSYVQNIQNMPSQREPEKERVEEEERDDDLEF